MFCSKCGNKLRDGAAFCPKCGAKVLPKRRAEDGKMPGTDPEQNPGWSESREMPEPGAGAPAAGRREDSEETLQRAEAWRQEELRRQQAAAQEEELRRQQTAAQEEELRRQQAAAQEEELRRQQAAAQEEELRRQQTAAMEEEAVRRQLAADVDRVSGPDLSDWLDSEEAEPDAEEAPDYVPEPEPAAKRSRAGRQQNRGGKKKGKTILIVLGAVILLEAAAGGLYLLNSGKQKEQAETAEAAAQETGAPEEIQAAGQEGMADQESAALQESAGLQESAPQQTQAESSEPAAPVTCTVMQAAQADLSGLMKVPVARDHVTQSSYLIQNGGDTSIDNSGWSAFDGQIETSWQEGNVTDGIGEYVTAAFDRPYQIQAITFCLGNHRVSETTDWYRENNRPRTLLLNLDGQEFTVDFPDEKTEFAVVFSEPVTASSLRTTISAVYAGTKYTDTIISEIGIYGNAQ